ncbi:MAG: hypothetical protein HQM10_11940 [Candidatus Riflebacteria bacterium]|nr:hypothetical protein [Candidatus Riflebacteria bacterium]
MNEKIISTNCTPDYIKKHCFEDLAYPEKSGLNDYKGYRLPGLIDLHIHGGFGWDFSWGNTEKIEEMLDNFLPTGLTGILAVIISSPEEQMLKAIADICSVAQKRLKPPFIHGIYLEGPFISEKRRGSHQKEYLINPDYEKLEKWFKLSGSRIKIVTVAPELPGSGILIQTAVELGVKPAIGHTDADHFTTTEAMKIGADHITHLYNAMRPFTHRDPTAVSAVLNYDRLTAEVIADQIHICPEILSLTFKILGHEKIVLISDGVCPMGLANGKYPAYGKSLTMENEKCTFTGGHLFGGGKHLLKCLSDLRKIPGFNQRELAYSAYFTPARLLGMTMFDSDVILDNNFNWIATRAGETWYHRG